MDGETVAGDDLFGRAVEDFYHGRPGRFGWERGDGLVIEQPISVYFEPGDVAPAYELAALAPLGRRVLDVGVGAGRHALLLQQRGHRVTGIDLSRRCLEISRARGVELALEMDALALDFPPASMDAVIYFSNNLSIGGTPEGVHTMLAQASKVLAPGGLIASINRDVSWSTVAEHQAWQRRNVALGLYPGQIRMRPRYNGMRGDWIDWLFISRAELEPIATRCGLEIAWAKHGEGGNYSALLCHVGDEAAKRAA